MKTEYAHSGPEELFALRQLDKFMSGHRGFIAGGCFKNLFSGEKIKDVDVFFHSYEDWSEACEELEGDEDFETVYYSQNVGGFRHKGSGMIVELVRSVFGTPEEVLDQFDFTVAKFAYYKATEQDEDGLETTVYKAVYHPKFFEHLHLKRCVIDNNIPKPMSSLNRMLRYAKYGYLPCTATKTKLVNALRGIPESEVLMPTNFYAGID